MNLRQMQVFHAIMTHGSVTDAARSLDVAQPSVSSVLKHAEQTLGVRLFARSGGRLQPTPEAEMLFPEVEQIYDQLARIESFTRDLRVGHSGRLALVANPTLASTLLPPVIAQFRNVFPTVRFRLQTAISASQMADRIVRREFDLGFAYGPSQEIHTGFETIGRSRIGVALPTSHPLASLASIAPADFLGQPLISFGAGSPIRSLAETIFSEAKCEFRPMVEASFSAAACALAQQGAGIAIVDMLILRHTTFPGLTIIPLATKRTIELRVIHPENRPHSMLSRTFTEMLRVVAREYEPAAHKASATSAGRSRSGRKARS